MDQASYINKFNEVILPFKLQLAHLFIFKLIVPMRRIFHDYGIHYLTIQPEFGQNYESETESETLSTSDAENDCTLLCCDEAKNES